jgi:hypothetical protein
MAAVALIAGLAGRLFLGEAYPSGTVYLQPFALTAPESSTDALPGTLIAPTYETRPPKASWPASVQVRCLRAQACKDKGVGQAARTATRLDYFVPRLEAKPRKGSTEVVYDYIPAREGLDSQHDEACKIRHRDLGKLRYAKDEPGDFFGTISDYCYFEDAVMRYAAKPAPHAAYQVLATAADLALEAVEHGDGKTRRPLTSAEKPKVAAARKAAAKDTDCTTEPAFLDEAIVLLTAHIKGSGATIRLSSYSDPGCAGHLGEYYLLDITEPGHPQATYRLLHYSGPL